MPPIADSLRLQPEGLQSRPDPSDQEALVAMEKTEQPVLPPKVTSAANKIVSSVPLKRSKLPSCPRASSSDASSPRSVSRKDPGSSFPLERCSSSSRLLRSSSSANDSKRLTRSYSSSSVSSCGSASEKSRDLKSLTSSLQMRRTKYGEKHPKVGSCWNKIGNLYFASRQYSNALDAYKHAVSCYQTDEAELACTYGNLGSAYWASGRPDKAIQFLHKALDVYEYHDIAEGRNPDESLTVASTLFQMGLCHTLLKNWKDAINCLEKCQKIQGKVLDPMDTHIGRTLDAIGKVHYFKGEYRTALGYHEEARRIKSACGENDCCAVIISLLNIAAVHAATKNWSIALNKYNKVLDLQKAELVRCRNQQGQPHLARAAQEMGETLQLVGDIHRHMNQEDDAQRYYKEASMLYEEVGLMYDDPRMKALK